MTDRANAGTYYRDRLAHILTVCRDVGILMDDDLPLVEPTDEVVVSAQYEKYGLKVHARVFRRVLGMADLFAHALNVPHVAVEADGDRVFVRVPKVVAGGVDFSFAYDMVPIKPGDMLLGRDDSGQQLILHLDHSKQHVLVVGMTGSGKTTLLLDMALSLLLQRQAIALLDPVATVGPATGLAQLSGHPRVWRGGVFTEPQECARALRSLLDNASNLHIFVDEVPDLTQAEPAAKDLLSRIAQRGRHSGLHLVMGVQNPLVSQIPAMRNAAVRLVGRVNDQQASHFAAGQPGVGAEKLRGSGDYIAVLAQKRIHFQAAMISPATLRWFMGRYPPREARTIPHVIAPDPSPTGKASGGGDAGRPEEPPCAACIIEIADLWRSQSKRPSRGQIREITERRHGAMYGDRRAYAARDAAMARIQVTAQLRRVQP